MSHLHDGHCHCGAIRVRLSLPLPAEKMQVRSCQCGFCLRQASRTVSDPAGHAALEIDGDHLGRYRFGTRTIDILLCTRCGAYAGAITEQGGRAWTTLNTRGLGMPGFHQLAVRKTQYHGEDLEARWARRMATWTPTEVRWSNASGARGVVLGGPHDEPQAGRCHCGAIRVELEMRDPAADHQVRACECGYCARKGAATTSDPAGHAVISVTGDRLGRYQFGTRTATTLYCRTCCVYVGAMLEEDGETRTALNVRGLRLEAFLDRTPEPVNYDGQTATERNARRKQKWTPTTIRVHS